MSTGFPTIRKDFNDFVGQIWDENEIANEESAVFLQRRDECIYMDWKKSDDEVEESDLLNQLTTKPVEKAT